MALGGPNRSTTTWCGRLWPKTCRRGRCGRPSIHCHKFEMTGYKYRGDNIFTPATERRMRRSALLILAAALAMPAAVEAQKKPSNSLHTRSMTLYLTEARNSSHPDDKRAALAKALEVGLEGAQKDGDNPQVWYLLGQTYL